MTNIDFQTACIHAGTQPDPSAGAISQPIYQTTTYAQPAIGEDKGYTYSRRRNPTVSALENRLAALENATGALCFRTGLAAIQTLFLTLLSAGDHVVCSDVVYGGTVRLLQQVLARFGVSVDFVDTSDPGLVQQALQKNTKLIFIETPANPTLKLTDVKAISAIAKIAQVPLAVDNTFLTPIGLPVLSYGADIAVYSTTKYISGNNTTVGGALLCKDKSLLEQLFFVRNTTGCIQAPQEAWLTLQGIKTLPIRFAAHSDNALKVARVLATHPEVERVFYPGLPSFKQYDLAQAQHVYHGGMLAFEVVGGLTRGRQFIEALQVCTLAENLGATETLVTHPVSMTHGDVPKAQREATGITDGLIRLSVGLENADAIIADLQQALAVTGRKAA